MTYDGLNNFIKTFISKDGQFIIRLKYKYTHDVSFLYSNEVFFYDSANNVICWFNDWWEGQEECDFEYMYNIDDLVMEHMKSIECINNISDVLQNYRRG